VLTLQNAFPVTLGANLGTTVTALLASVAADSPDALTIALAHVSFNVLGILIFYPIPQMRQIPIWLAERTGEIAVRNRSLVLVYIVGLFIVVPVGILLVT
jgi:sodium-dependent phosphate cotransporter